MPRARKYNDREYQEGKNFQCILYQDSESYDCKLLLARLEYFWDKFYYILHDKDVYTEYDYDKYLMDYQDLPIWKVGELKKPHYHVVCHNESNMTLGRASTKYGIPSNMVERCKSLKSSVQYLIHLNNKDKFQYHTEEIITNDMDIGNLLNNNSANEKARSLIEFIYSDDCYSLFSLSEFAINTGCWDELRRGQHLYTKLFYERIEHESKSNRYQEN